MPVKLRCAAGLPTTSILRRLLSLFLSPEDRNAWHRGEKNEKKEGGGGFAACRHDVMVSGGTTGSEGRG